MISPYCQDCPSEGDRCRARRTSDPNTGASLLQVECIMVPRGTAWLVPDAPGVAPEPEPLWKGSPADGGVFTFDVFCRGMHAWYRALGFTEDEADARVAKLRDSGPA